MKINAAAMISRSLLIGLCLMILAPWFSSGRVHAATTAEIPKNAILVVRYILEVVDAETNDPIDPNRLTPLLDFFQAEKSPDTLYQTPDVLDMASAFHAFSINTDLDRIVGYTMNENIPSVLFWPSSIRMSTWRRIEGGKEQLVRFRAASSDPGEGAFFLKGVEHVEIAPDQNSGAYYVYDLNKKIMTFPYQTGRLMIVASRQKKPSDVGLRGWVLGKDEDWTYIYTQDRGLNVTGLGWAKTYMYDSFSITVYWQKDMAVPEVTCSVISGVKAGWTGINMVKSHHIYGGLNRVAQAFSHVMENPKIPDPSRLSATFSSSNALSTETLRTHALNYFKALGQRMTTLKDVPNTLKKDFDPPALVDQMSRDELVAMLALDYWKKILDRDPVMENHPF